MAVSPVDVGVIIAILLNLFVGIVLIVATIILWIQISEQTKEIQKCVDVLPGCLESLQKSEMPIAAVCAIANHFSNPLHEIAQEYVKDKEQRRAIILANFRKDSLTGYCLNKYKSKFLAHGYIGEEFLVQQ